MIYNYTISQEYVKNKVDLEPLAWEDEVKPEAKL